MKDDRVYLSHINDSIRKILLYSHEGEEAFLKDTKSQDAVIRNFEIIGEAVKKLSEEFKASHPDIPWRRISGMRDKLIHDYFGVNLTIVWDTIVTFLPDFRRRIEKILEK